MLFKENLFDSSSVVTIIFKHGSRDASKIRKYSIVPKIIQSPFAVMSLLIFSTLHVIQYIYHT